MIEQRAASFLGFHPFPDLNPINVIVDGSGIGRRLDRIISARVHALAG
jgi:hypothetical protein